MKRNHAGRQSMLPRRNLFLRAAAIWTGLIAAGHEAEASTVQPKSADPKLHWALSRQHAARLRIDAGVRVLRVEGFAYPGDGGAASYRRAIGEPPHPGKFKSSDGSWWELAEAKVSPQMFGAKGDGKADDAGAFSEAILWALATFPRVLEIPPGHYLQAAAWPVIDKPIRIQGGGGTYIRFNSQVAGQCITVRDVGFGTFDKSAFLGFSADRAFDDPASATAPVELVGLTLLGDRSAVEKQHALVCEGNVDFSRFDLDIMYFTGHGAWFGKSARAGLRGGVRENSSWRFRIRNCGSVDGTSSMRFEVGDSPDNPNWDGTNLLQRLDAQIVFPYGRGVEFVDTRNKKTEVGNIYMLSGSFLLHGRYSKLDSDHELMRFEGDVRNIDIDVSIPYSSSGVDIIFCRNELIKSKPSNCRLSIRMTNSRRGIYVEDARNLSLDFISLSTRAEAFRAGNLDGPVEIRCSSDEPFLKLEKDIRFSVPGAAVALDGGEKMRAFFSSNELGQEGVLTSISGVVGRVTRRAGNEGLGGEILFLPESPHPDVIPAGEYFSKIVVSDSQFSKIGGRIDFSNRPRGGATYTSHFQSQSMLKIDRWFLSVDGRTGTPMISFGDPALGHKRNGLQLLQKKTVKCASDIDISGVNLVLIEGGEVPIRNLVGGVDAQSLTILSMDGRCLIAKGGNIAIPGDTIKTDRITPMKFVYLKDIDKWLMV